MSSQDLVDAAGRGNLSEVTRLLSIRNVDKNFKASFGLTPLISAAEGGHVNVVDKLISAGVTVDLEGWHGTTALIQAAERGHVDVVERLLKTSANKNYQASFGETALIRAAKNGHAKVVEVLLKAGVDINLEHGHSESAVYKAIVAGQLETTLLLLNAGASLETSPRGNNPMARIPNEQFRQALASAAALGKEVSVPCHTLKTHVASVQARRDWMKTRDALEVQYETAEKALNFAECAKLWQDITAHEKLSASLVLSVEDYRTLADRHAKMVAAVDAKCAGYLAAKDFTSLETCSLVLKDLQGMDRAKLAFPADAKMSAALVSPAKTGASTASIIDAHTAKQVKICEEHQAILNQHKTIVTQAGGVKAREDWMKRKDAKQAEYDKEEASKQYLECAKLGKDLVALDAQGAKLPLSAEDYRTLGERYVQLVDKYKLLAARHQQAILDLGNARKELLVVKDFAGLDKLGQVLTKLQALSFASFPPLQGVKLPVAVVSSGTPVSTSAAEHTSNDSTPNTDGKGPSVDPANSSSDVKLAYTADPTPPKTLDPAASATAPPPATDPSKTVSKPAGSAKNEPLLMNSVLLPGGDDEDSRKKCVIM